MGKIPSPPPAPSDATLWLRQNLPTVAGFVDAMTEEFGRDGFRVTFAAEGEHVVGKPLPPAEFSVSGEALFAHIPVRIEMSVAKGARR